MDEVDALYERLREQPPSPARRAEWDAALPARCRKPGRTLYVPLRLFQDWYAGEPDVRWTGEDPETVWEQRPTRIGGGAPDGGLADPNLWATHLPPGARLAGNPAHCIEVVRTFFRCCTWPLARPADAVVGDVPLVPPGLWEALRGGGGTPVRPALWELLFDTLGVLCLDPPPPAQRQGPSVRGLWPEASGTPGRGRPPPASG